MIFLFSPDISLFDLLPDVIGWFLVVLGLSRLSDIEMRAEDAKSLAKRMLLFSAVKLVLSLFAFRFNSSDLLLAAFSYGIVEMITVIPLVNNLFTGLDYTAMRVNAPLDSDKLGNAKWYLYIFFALKNFLAVLPATVSFFDSRLTGDYSADTWFVDFDAAMRMIMVFAFFLSAVMSIVMLCFFIPFWVRIAKNRDLNTKMCEHRRVTVLELPTRMIKKNTSFVFSLFAPAVVFFFDFYIDGVEVLPTFVGFGAIFAAAVFVHKKMGHSCRALIALSALGTAVSLSAFLYRLIPLVKNKFVIDYNFSSKPYTVPVSLLTSVLMAVTLVLLYSLAGKFNKSYTKYKLEDSLVLYMIGGVILSAFSFVLYSYPDFNTTFVFPSLVFGIPFCALGAYYFVKLGRQIKKDNKD